MKVTKEMLAELRRGANKPWVLYPGELEALLDERKALRDALYTASSQCTNWREAFAALALGEDEL